VLFLAAGLLYASVGQAGASGYLALMAFFGLAPDVMKPTALVLNILVATITSLKFYRAGCFSWSVFWPFAVASIPFSFIGGAISLPGYLYKPVVGVILFYVAYRFFRADSTRATTEIIPIPLWPALASGVAIGLLSGLTGIGGGIFLSPLLLLMGWAETRQTLGVSAAFILVNSIAGLLGHLSSVASLPAPIPIWAIAAIIGAYVGAEYGSKRLGNITLKRLLAVVLAIAGLKIIFT
jgi:hypothetical protein